MIATLLYVLYTLVIAALIINLLLSGVRPTKTLAWIMVLIFIPIVGIILYFSLGRNRRKNKFFKLRRTRQIEQYLRTVKKYYTEVDQHHEEPEVLENIDLVRLIIKNSSFLPSKGNQVQILQDGEQTFRAIFEALEQAQNFIHIQYYIFENGELADKFAEVCKKKVRENVEVRMIYDGVGSRHLSNSYIQDLARNGIEIHGFMPLHIWATTKWINYRNHRKIVVVDGKIGFVGGVNVADKYIKGDPVLGKWHDHHLCLVGPAVDNLHTVFAIDWNFVTGSGALLAAPYFNNHSTAGDMTVQIVFSGPDSDFAAVRQQYFKMINDAKKYIYLSNSYLIPGQSIIEALQTAALSGCDVRIMLPDKSDSSIVRWSIRSYFEVLLEAGVRIYLFQDGFLHNKTIVSDDEIVSVGTANLDIRSFEQNFEVNALIYDRSFAIKMREFFLEDCRKCVEVELDQYRMRPIDDRLKEGLAKIWSPIL
ncbi:MAG: cardiolipin synthase [Saprospiraceae bacterium]|nr:cardiolipin synthase [Saprospiraceae bacterium]